MVLSLLNRRGLARGYFSRKSVAAVILTPRLPKTPALAMTRGIHLKHLTATDLSLLGLPQELLEADGVSADPDQLATEGDPTLVRITQEVRAALEDTLVLLDQALTLGQGPAPIHTPTQGRNAQPAA